MNRRIMLILVLGTLGCANESPFAPAPGSRNACIDDQVVGLLDCDTSCPGLLVESAAACALTLEGELDRERRVCRFGPSGLVRFAQPLPRTNIDPLSTSFSIELGNKPCLSFAFDAANARSQTLSISGSGICYEQVERSETDAGTLNSVDLICGGQRARGSLDGCDPLLRLEVLQVDKTIEFRLRAGSRLTPLFFCREADNG